MNKMFVAIQPVSETTLLELHNRFNDYAQSYSCNNSDENDELDIKITHTKQVCREIKTLGKALLLPEDGLRLAEIIALFHDIGRFEQYARHQTYADHRSINHAELGVSVIKGKGLLDMLDNTTQDLILKSIAYHNQAYLPQVETATCLFFSKLLRDADKLDIFRIVIAHYHRHQKGQQQSSAIELRLPDTPGISNTVYECLIERKIVHNTSIKNLNDLKLLQIGWVYDINFRPTLEAIVNRRYLQQIRETLTPSGTIDRIFKTIDSFLKEAFC